jgi:lysophospholipase
MSPVHPPQPYTNFPGSAFRCSQLLPCTPTTMDLTHPSDESKVLVIYTGGTIGMLVGPHGYRNEPHFLTETLRCQSRFHDPFEDSLFSHSGSVEGYRRWSNSGRASPVADASVGYAPTLCVRSTRPIGTPSTLSPDLSSQTSPNKVNVQCRKIAEDVYEGHLPSLVTPRTSIHGQGGKRIRYAVLEVALVSSLSTT